MERLIFHVDVNSAFLSWEAAEAQIKEGLPDLQEIPSCIGGDPKLKARSIVVAKSIRRKNMGWRQGNLWLSGVAEMSDLVYVPGDFALYQKMFPGV